MFSKSRPIRYCEQCHRIRHNERRRTTNHVLQKPVISPWKMSFDDRNNNIFNIWIRYWLYADWWNLSLTFYKSDLYHNFNKVWILKISLNWSIHSFLRFKIVCHSILNFCSFNFDFVDFFLGPYKNNEKMSETEWKWEIHRKNFFLKERH